MVKQIPKERNKVIKKIKPSRWVLFRYYIIGIILLSIVILGMSIIETEVQSRATEIIIILFIIGLIPIIKAEIERLATTYEITNRGVNKRWKFLSKKISSADFNDITDLHLTQNIIDRILQIGTLYINTAGSEHVEIIFKGISDPEKIKKIIQKHI